MTLHQSDLGTAVTEHATAKVSSINIKKKNVVVQYCQRTFVTSTLASLLIIIGMDYTVICAVFVQKHFI